MKQIQSVIDPLREQIPDIFYMQAYYTNYKSTFQV